MAEKKTRKFILLDEFKEKLKLSGTSVIEDILITHTCEIKPGDIEWDGVEFINCEFQGNLAFLDLEIKHGIKLTDCDINGDLLFSECTIPDYDPKFNEESYSINLEGCIVKKSLNISNCPNIDRGVRLKKTTCDRLYIQGNKVLNGGFRISASTIQTNCDIQHNTISGHLNFSKSIIEPKTRIWNNSCSYLTFFAAEFKSDVHVGGGVMKNVIFNYGVYHDHFNIGPFNSDGQLTLIGGDFKTKLAIQYSDTTNKIFGGCETIHLSGCSFGTGMSVVGSYDLLKQPFLKAISIIANEKLSGDIEFRCLNVEKFSFHGGNTKAKIKLHSIQPIKLSFFEFSNSAKIQLFDVKAYHEGDSEFEVFNSSLGQTEFYNTFLNSFKKIVITNSVVSDIITSNIRWFDPKLLEPGKHESKDTKNFYNRNNREVFRQLKFAMEKQGNKIYALEFKSYEMESYKKELKFKKKKKWHDDLSNKIILYLNAISNSHGINPIKPFAWIIGFTLFFYWLIVISISSRLSWVPSIQFADWQNSLEEFKHYWSALPKMLNPLFVFDKTFLDEQSIKLSTSLFEFFHRIILSYLLFQFIAAFRKFVK